MLLVKFYVEKNLKNRTRALKLKPSNLKLSTFISNMINVSYV